MKAILKFDLTDSDDRMAHQRCIKSLDLALALWDINYNLYDRFRDLIELNPESDPADILREEINNIFEKYNITHLNDFVE